ncbi:hypothetical protein GCM10011608_10280 [Micromonospora sonchi]|uniref:Uncharacterized protein n=1 Tax=Micromonospora sonchi TaxID=1763543 RepID=A0A917TNJ7_9ACTN|nr:hypothetical protein [Micromonospora sonchi]GGM27472.1 hypothetical protein GCM10011608_10280 [Micromonospora sonchi]
MLDLSELPDDLRRRIQADAAAVLREVWQSFPKTFIYLTSEPEEDTTDDH